MSPRTVAAMTRNHIPGIGIQFGSEYYKEASWGLGWGVQSNEKWKYFTSSLLSLSAYHHGGAATTFLAVDQADDLVTVYFEVAMESTPDELAINNAELFQNMTVAAIDD